MHVTKKDEMKCEMENVMIWGSFWVHHEADKNSMSAYSDTLYDKHKIKTN